MFRFPEPGPLVIGSGMRLCRICRRSCAKLSNEGFYCAGDSFDTIQIGTGVGDRSGELRVLADFAFCLDYIINALYSMVLFVLIC